MKKKIFIILLLVVIVVVTILILFTKSNKRFYLESKYYSNNDFIEIKEEEYNNLIKNKESFALFVYQPMCVTSSNFEKILKEFKDKNLVRIYKISFDTIKKTNLKKHIEYYPSFVIFKDGEVVDYLQTDKEEDLEVYTTYDGFENWFTKYVIMDENYNSSSDKVNTDNSNTDNNSDDEDNNNDKNNDKNNVVIDALLDDVSRDESKVNIYFFWGDGCPHCEEEYLFLESIDEEYGKYYNLYMFETWYNEDNAKLLKIFAKNMNKEVSGVPFVIIGNKTFIGFNESNKQEIIDAIESQHENSFDVYFDKINK